MLGEDVERRHNRLEQVESALPYGSEKGRALHELIARGRVQPAGGSPVTVVVGPADALEERADGTWRTDLAHELDGADVDPQLERGGRNEGAQVTGPQPRLDDPTARRRQAAVVRRNQQRGIDVAVGALGVTEALRQLMGHPLGHLAAC